MTKKNIYTFIILFSLLISSSNCYSFDLFQSIGKGIDSLIEIIISPFSTKSETKALSNQAKPSNSKENKVIKKDTHLIVSKINTKKKINYYKFTVETTPTDCSVKIMNIIPKYHAGISLNSGTYDILVEKKGYAFSRTKIRVKDSDLIVKIKLQTTDEQQMDNLIDEEIEKTN